MSNHVGGHMLNEVLQEAIEQDVFKKIGKRKTRHFLEKVLEVGWDYDCNPDEILEGIGEELGICYCCTKFKDDLRDGMCAECNEN